MAWEAPIKETIVEGARQVVSAAPSFTNVETVTIVLTATAVILAAFAIVIGVLAFIGYWVIRRGAARAGARAGEKAAQDDLKAYLDGPEVRMLIEQLVDNVVANHIRTRMAATVGSAAEADRSASSGAPAEMKE